MSLIIRGTLCAFLALVLIILFVTGLYFSWAWWIDGILIIGFFVSLYKSISFFRRDKEQDTRETREFYTD